MLRTSHDDCRSGRRTNQTPGSREICCERIEGRFRGVSSQPSSRVINSTPKWHLSFVRGTAKAKACVRISSVVRDSAHSRLQRVLHTGNSENKHLVGRTRNDFGLLLHEECAWADCISPPTDWSVSAVQASCWRIICRRHSGQAFVILPSTLWGQCDDSEFFATSSINTDFTLKIAMPGYRIPRSRPWWRGLRIPAPAFGRCGDGL